MAITHEVLVKPAPGTKIAPVYNYDDKQKAKMTALKEVRSIDLTPRHNIDQRLLPYSSMLSAWRSRSPTRITNGKYDG